MSFRSKKSGQHYPITRHGKMIYKNTSGRGTVSVESTDSAVSTVVWLNKQWKQADTETEQLKLYKAAREAWLKAVETRDDPNAPNEAREEANSIALFYDEWMMNHTIS